MVKFLSDVLKAFGFGDYFIQWIELLYSNASTKININGFLTDPIPLKCGVRQGCPLSALLYVLVIEILALQLRANPNIVGFTIQGEKIISSHYADDAVIKITQNIFSLCQLSLKNDIMLDLMLILQIILNIELDDINLAVLQQFLLIS